MSDINGKNGNEIVQMKGKSPHDDNFVLEKSIFSNVFEKDIRRVFIYKKAERLAKAIHLVTPAFVHSPSLRNRADSIAMSLVDAAILAPNLARNLLSRELLALSSLLSIARVGGLLSSMNANLITREAHVLLQEVAAYEEPHLFLDEAPTLSDIARKAGKNNTPRTEKHRTVKTVRAEKTGGNERGRPVLKDEKTSTRREGILSVIESKGHVSIKDISTVMRGVSEKTVQRELQTMVDERLIKRTGERRWSTYSII